jgi:hypothetical protein
LNSFVREPLGASRSKYSFAILVAIEPARSFQRDVLRDRTEQWIGTSPRDRLSDRKSTIELMGSFEHSRATNFSPLLERNSASRGRFADGGDGRKEDRF